MANGIARMPGLATHCITTNNMSTIAQPSHAELTSKLAGQDLTGICGCGTCTVHTYLLNGCPHSSQIPALSLPFVDLSYLKGTQRQIVLGRLYLEYQFLLSKFSRLKREIFRTIMSKKLTFYYLSNTVVKFDSFMPSLPHDDKMAEVRKAKTVPRLYSMFPDDASFLEYQIFEDLVEDLKVERNVDSMRAYKQELDLFSQRGIFECPLFSQAGKDGHSNFILEMSQDRSNLIIHELVCIQEQICSVLRVVSNTICLCNVSKLQSGNIQVIFRIANFMKEVLLPLSREQQTKLRQLGFLDWSFYSGLDISYNPAQLANQLLSSGRQNDSNHNSDRRYSNERPANMQKMDDLSSDDDDEDESPSRKKLKPAPGKKTRGRVKIPMEYIKNKLRRYTTFSKRKSNIMKKAYELSTLTGTQVMLMVASETGHVYTFATPKLQPMITSDAGKALIQTCLHQPDPVIQNFEGAELQGCDRMCSSGYEETELGRYAHPSEKDKQKQHDHPPSSIIPPASSSHEMLSMYNPPPPSLPPSLANELLPSGILHSPLSTSNNSLLPPPLISPDAYSPGPVEGDGDELLDSHSSVS